MTIGNNTYIISQVPSSSVPSSLNVHPPPHSCGPSSRNVATSHVCTVVTQPVVSQVQVPPVVLGGRVHTSRGHVTTSRAYIPTSGMYIPTSGAYIPTSGMYISTFGAYIPTYGVSHGTSHAMTYGPYYAM